MCTKKKMSDSRRSVPDWFSRLSERARIADSAPPFSDQSILDFRAGIRELVAIDEYAAALVASVPSVEAEFVVDPASVGIVPSVEAEFVVDPDARGQGIGTRLLETLLHDGATLFWAHGDHPAARALAATHGLVPVRELLHLSANFPTPHPDLPTSASNFAEELAEVGKSGRGREPGTGGESSVANFVVGQDEDEWVALNALVFAHHAEQGAVTRGDLEQLEAEPWFSSENFLVLRRDGRMIGYCWLKVEGGRGEFYVVGVSPNHSGEKLGSLLFDAGMHRLRSLGLRQAHLYVDGDNLAALRLYRSRGFAQDSIDIQYSTST
jgi:mycothiol synthase